MVDIGTSDKLTNLWPAVPGRRIDKPGLKDQPSRHQQQNQKKKDKNQVVEDGPGKNIDEYA